MTLGEAREVVAAAVRAVQTQGYDVHGWDDGSIFLTERATGDQTYVDPEHPDDRPRDHPGRAAPPRGF